jgi:hypothetical protein
LWPEDLNRFPAKPGKILKKESRKKPKPTRTRNSQKGANPKISNLQNNTQQCAKPEFAKNIRQTWKERVTGPVLRLLS